MSHKKILKELCNHYGVRSEYKDNWGNIRKVEPDTLVRILSAMGIDAGSLSSASDALRSLRARRFLRMLPPVHVVSAGASVIRIPVVLQNNDIGQTFQWLLIDENGSLSRGEILPRKDIRASEKFNGGVITDLSIPLKPAAGYYEFYLKIPGRRPVADQATRLIVAPRKCYQPPALADGNRRWGIATAPYALRSEGNIGIGDFRDVATLAKIAAKSGADLIGLTPLHALFYNDPERVSPYSPSSRSFLNYLFFHPEWIPEFSESAAARRFYNGAQTGRLISRLQSSDIVRYGEVAGIKKKILEILFDHFCRHHLRKMTRRGREFLEYKKRGGENLKRFALHEALQEHFSASQSSMRLWPDWPAPYRNPNSKAVAGFEKEKSERVDFFFYLQWIAETQLGRVRDFAGEKGLAVGLYTDLAVSIDGGGAESWSRQTLYALSASIGAPPDAFNMKGQKWGLPPMIPMRLKEARFDPFIEVLQKNMRYSGALRIDHVMGLFRLFWIPEGCDPRSGAYVHYPLEDLLSILALESHRNRCAVIGEDLGTVPDEVRKELKPRGLFSYKVFYFEKTGRGQFKKPSAYPSQSLVTVSTHDLPTLAGFWAGEDIKKRKELNLFPSKESEESAVEERVADKNCVLKALAGEGRLSNKKVLSKASGDMTKELSLEIHRQLARSPARIMMIQLEDALLLPDQQNIPGTMHEYPNWKKKIPADVDTLNKNPRFTALADCVNHERKNHRD